MHRVDKTHPTKSFNMNLYLNYCNKSIPVLGLLVKNVWTKNDHKDSGGDNEGQIAQRKLGRADTARRHSSAYHHCAL